MSDIFKERGITPEIRDARPYTPWETDNLDPVREAYGGLGRAGLNFALRIARQSPGYLIRRYPPDGLGLDDIYPEFRPDNAVKTDPRRKWHQHFWNGRMSAEMPPGEPSPGTLAGKAPAGMSSRMALSGKALRDHVNRGSIRYLLYEVGGFAGYERSGIKTPPDHLPTEHCGVNRRDFHYHESWAKYVFPTAGLIPQERWHDHQVEVIEHDHELLTDKWVARHVGAEHDGIDEPGEHPHTRGAQEWPADKLAAHLAKQHDGIDVLGEHPHTWSVKDKSLNLARRLDVHPLAM